jgi:hypothetical protein
MQRCIQAMLSHKCWNFITNEIDNDPVRCGAEQPEAPPSVEHAKSCQWLQNAYSACAKLVESIDAASMARARKQSMDEYELRALERKLPTPEGECWRQRKPCGGKVASRWIISRGQI